jgi:hypothetical protein
MEKYDAILQLVRGFLLTNTEALAILTRNPELKDVEEVKDYVRNLCPTFAKIVRFSDHLKMMQKEIYRIAEECTSLKLTKQDSSTSCAYTRSCMHNVSC